MRRILVLTDFSPASDRALSQAERLARSFGAEVHLFHKIVYPPPLPDADLLGRLDDTARFDYVLREVIERPERDASEELGRRAERLEREGLKVATRLERSGDVYEQVEMAIETLKPDLIVMGTHGRAGIRRWLMGSLAEKVLRHSDVDVLTLHDDSPVAGTEEGMGEVLVATDFSQGARRALDAADGWTSAVGGSICLLHVLESRFVPESGEGTRELIEATQELRAKAEKALREELATRRGVVVLAEGHLAREIVRVADERNASMIVMGRQGLSGFPLALIGSATEKVARLARTPVLTVR
jgi:nucleotide-binding universal stress UspA family protein